MNKTLKILIPVICINALIYVLFFVKSTIFKKETVSIALVGLHRSETGQDIINAVTMYLEKVNAEGGIDGKRIELRLYDDNNDVAKAEQIARQIAAEKEVLLVLGHHYSSTSDIAGKIYGIHRIPAITAAATAESVTAEKPWYFRTIPNNKMQADFIANYLYLTLKKSSVSIVYDEDLYGTSLAQNFEKTVNNLGVSVKEKWSFNLKGPNPDTQLKWIIEDLVKSDDPGGLFLAVHAKEGAYFISELKDAGKHFLCIGPDTFSDRDFILQFSELPKEKSTPGYYTDGIYSSSPFISSIADDEAYQFRQAFLRNYGKEPAWSAYCYFDAARVAVEAMKKAGLKGKGQLRGDRERIRNALAGFFKKENAVDGITGLIFFDKNGDLNRPYAMGVYKDQRLLPAFTQYKQVIDPKGVKNLFKRVLEGEYIVIDRELMSKFNVIYTDVFINDIKKMDIHHSTCTIDFNILFQFSGDLNLDKIDFSNAITPVRLNKPVAEKIDGQTVTRIYRVKADFLTGFDLNAYPFFSYMVPIRMRYTSNTDHRMIHIADLSRISGLPVPAYHPMDDPGGDAVKWDIKDIQYYREHLLDEAGMGQPGVFVEQDGTNITQFNVEIRLEKEGWSDVIKIFIPSIIMLVALYLTYYMPMDRLAFKVLLVAAVIIVNAGFHFKLLSDIPMGYSTSIEHVLLSVYFFAVISVISSIIVSKNYRKGEYRNCKRLMLVGKVVYPFMILSLAFLITLMYYLPGKGGGL